MYEELEPITPHIRLGFKCLKWLHLYPNLFPVLTNLPVPPASKTGSGENSPTVPWMHEYFHHHSFANPAASKRMPFPSSVIFQAHLGLDYLCQAFTKVEDRLISSIHD